MKRLFVVILSILYMASATGTTVHLHYCIMHTEEEHNCGFCGMKKNKSKGCCKDESKQIKSNEQHKVSTINFESGYKNLAIPPIYNLFSYSEPCPEPNSRSISFAHAPPLIVWDTCPIYLKLRNIRV
jgi:hypothetical protein